MGGGVFHEIRMDLIILTEKQFQAAGFATPALFRRQKPMNIQIAPAVAEGSRFLGLSFSTGFGFSSYRLGL
jgi:hypothetical protein